nr:hypothetical protein [Cylindrotheca closterium]
MHEFRRKYKNYIRIKRIIPLSLIAPFTSNELSKMAYAAAIGSKSISLTLPGIIGYSLPAFFFFHMSYYYAPNKFKPACQACKYILGAPFLTAGLITDELMSNQEEKFFGQAVPIDVGQTGGTIPPEIGDMDKFRDLLNELKTMGHKFTRKTH